MGLIPVDRPLPVVRVAKAGSESVPRNKDAKLWDESGHST